MKSTSKKSRSKRDSNPGSSALEADSLTTRPTRRSDDGDDTSDGDPDDGENQTHCANDNGNVVDEDDGDGNDNENDGPLQPLLSLSS